MKLQRHGGKDLKSEVILAKGLIKLRELQRSEKGNTTEDTEGNKN